MDSQQENKSQETYEVIDDTCDPLSMDPLVFENDDSSAIKGSDESNEIVVVSSSSSSQVTTATGEVIDLLKDPVIYFEDASHLLKDQQNPQTKSKPAKMERKKKVKPACITLDSSSEEEEKEVESNESSEYNPKESDSRESSVIIEDDKSNNNSDSPKPSRFKRKMVIDSSDEDSKSEKESSDEYDDEVVVVKTKKNNKRRRVVVDSDEDDVGPNPDDDEEMETSQKTRTRRMKDRDELEKETIDAEEAEKERKKRLAERQKEFNGIEYETTTTEDGMSLIKRLKNLTLDSDSKNTKNPNPVVVHSSLVHVLKSHQAEGIQFMYDCAFESLEQFRKGNDGGGGILAHCMGLGKTLQVVAFIHTILSHKEISKDISKILVVVPKNVVLNWRNEFEKWISSRYQVFSVYELDSFKEDRDRLECLRHWKEEEGGSVMIIGYDMFRILTQSPEDRVEKKRRTKPPPKPKKLTKKQKKFQTMQVEFRKLLQNPGPDLVVLDEAHKLKNDESLIARTMVKIQTKRRICLTGTPLQNNLKEYYVMVNFVRNNLLGTMAEFKNQFVNIIERGRTKDASDWEVRLMRRRCFVLYKRLDAIVQRKDISVLKQEIPGKLEYVLKIRLTEPQIELYQEFLRMIEKESGTDLRKRLLSDYHIFSRIWTHPYQLIHHAEELDRKNMLKDDMDGFIDDDEEISDGPDSDSNSLDSGNSDIDEVGEFRRGTRQSKRLAKDSSSSPILSPPLSPIEEIKGWWSHVVNPIHKFNLEMSNKLVVLFDIIKRCEAIGDKLLVFSQSLESLRLIRDFLENFDKENKWFVDGHECLSSHGEKWGWKRGEDYLVIDGSVNSRDRESIQTRFNKKTNLRARLMLISTRAGSLGTNMVAANRVVIFDSCWNPSHDTQSLFRVYRIGQIKPVYIYRLIAQGTMEECIYKRQVTKDSVSMRVIDEAQIERHFFERDLEELYTLSSKAYNENDEKLNAPPKDRMLADLILKNPSAVVDYVFHDNLFENIDGEKLTPEEVNEAWEEYGRVKNNPTADQSALSQMQYAAILQATSSSDAQPQSSILAEYLAQMRNQRLIPNGLQMVTQQQAIPSGILQNQNLRQGVVNSVPVDPALSKLIPTDNIYSSCLSHGLNLLQATSVTYVKMICHILLEKLPQHLRGGINEVGTTITDIIGDTTQTTAERTRQVIGLFTTFQQVFRQDLNTSLLLDQYMRISPWLAPARVILPKPH